MQTTAFTSPGFDYSADLSAIERRKKLAEALQAQSMTPMEQAPVGAGQFATPISPWQGAAKLAQAFVGARNSNKAYQQERDLSKKAQTDYATMVKTGLQQLSGTPERTIQPDPQENAIAADQGTPQVAAKTIPGQAPNPAGALATFGSHPLGQQLAPLAMQEMQRQRLLAALQGPQAASQAAAGSTTAPSYGSPGFAPGGQAQAPSSGGPNLNLHLLTDPSGKSYVSALEKSGDTQGRVSYDQEGNAFTVGKDGRVIKLPGIRARDKMEMVNTGDATVPVNPFTQNQPIPHSITPQNRIENAWTMGIGMPGASGGTPASPAQPAQAQQPMPQQQPRPAAPSNLPPKTQAEVEASRLKYVQELEGKRQFNMGGLGDVLGEAERVLKGEGRGLNGAKVSQPLPTGSAVGNAVDTAAGWFGAAPKGAAQADQLRALSGALVAKMPRMEGPQSDKDVQNYREMAGQIGDASLPISRRVAALETVKSLWAKYEGGQQAQPTVGVPTGIDPKVWGVMTPQEKALWQRR